MQMLLCLWLAFKNFRYAENGRITKQVSSFNLHSDGLQMDQSRQWYIDFSY